MHDQQVIQFQVNGYTGWDLLFSAIYTDVAMAKRVAIKSMRTGAPFADAIPGDETTLLLILPNNISYKIVDEQGNVEIYNGPRNMVSL